LAPRRGIGWPDFLPNMDFSSLVRTRL